MKLFQFKEKTPPRGEYREDILAMLDAECRRRHEERRPLELGWMLAARFVVGIGSAAIAPVVIAYILSEFPADRVSGGFSLYMLAYVALLAFLTPVIKDVLLYVRELLIYFTDKLFGLIN